MTERGADFLPYSTSITQSDLMGQTITVATSVHGVVASETKTNASTTSFLIHWQQLALTVSS